MLSETFSWDSMEPYYIPAASIGLQQQQQQLGNVYISLGSFTFFFFHLHRIHSFGA